MTMTQRVAIVTGAASGIGKATAEVLAAQGHDVVVADMDSVRGEAVAETIGGCFVHVDLASRTQCKRLVEKVLSRYETIHILVNNAGFQHVSPIEEFPEEAWDRLIAVMLSAPFLLTRYVWPTMKAQGWGRVINMGSIHSLVASPFKVGYVSAKHGLLGLTRTTALEGGAYGITVNTICPAYVRTPLVESQIDDQAGTRGISPEEVVEKVMLEQAAIKRLIEPEEVAALVAYMCSDAAAPITGSTWELDLGWTAR